MSNDPDNQVSVDDRETSPGWHVRALLIIIAILGLAYVVAVRTVLK